MSLTDARQRLLRPLVALLAVLLVLPVGQLLVAGPAHAVPNVAEGAVYDDFGDPLSGVTVSAVPAPSAAGTAATDSTDAEGAYQLTLTAGTYRLTFAKEGFTTTSYGGEDPLDVVVDAAGQIRVDGDLMVGNVLDDVSLSSTVRHPVSGVVRNASTQSLAGIEVAAFRTGETEDPADTAITTASGAYFLELPSGLYSVRYTDPGGTYLTTWYGGAEPGAEIAVQADGSVLADDAPTTCPSLCPVTLAEPSADAAYPVSGVVVDANGEGIDGLAVRADPIAPTPAAQVETATTAVDPESDEHGSYELLLEPGTYRISYDGGDHFGDATYPGADEDPATVGVSSTGVVTVDGAVVTGGELDGVELTGAAEYQLSGTVTDAGGAGLAGITVTVYPEGDSEPVASATTTTGGGYTVPALRIGTYVVRFSDQVAGGGDYLVTWLGEGATGSPVTLGQGGVVSYGGATVTALPTVIMAEPAPDTTFDVSGSVADAIGAPIDGITVRATPTDGTPMDQDESTTTGLDDVTGERGVYHLPLEAGSYRISFAASAHFGSATYNGDGEAPVTVVVDATGVVRVGAAEVLGGVLDPVELTGTTTYPLRGRVTDGTTPLAGIPVKVYAEGETAPGDEVATDTTDATGQFDPRVRIGTYVLQFSGTVGSTIYSTRWYGDGLTGTEVQMGQGGTVYVDGDEASLSDVVMTVADDTTRHPLAGTVVDANDEGLAGVTVTAEAQGGGAVTDQTTSAGDEGTFELGLRKGSYTISYQRTGPDGYAKTYYLDPEGELGTERAVVVVATNGTMTISGVAVTAGLDPQVLTNATRHVVTGSVVDADGDAVGGITVQALRDGETAVVATATTTSGGSYSLSLPVGAYQVRFTDNLPAAPTYAVTYLGGEPPSVVTVRTGGSVRIDEVAATPQLPPVSLAEVAADTTFDLKGRVYDGSNDSGAELDGVTVTAVPVGRTPAANAASDVTGPDAATPSLGDAGIYRIPVRPGTYRLRFGKTGFATAFLMTYDDVPAPAVVTVGANGAVSAPTLDMVGGVVDDVTMLLPAPRLLKAPALTGRLAVGQVVTTTFGTWSPAVSKDSAYLEWFLNGRPADQFSLGGYGERFRVPASAATKRLSYRITVDDPDGYRAQAIFTSKAVVVPKAASTVTGKLTKGRLTATVKVPAIPRPTGKVTVLKGKKKVGQGVVVAKKRGVVVIKLKLKRGKHKLTIVYAGTATVKGSRKVITVKV